MRLRVTLALALAATMLLGVQVFMRLREPIAAGIWYPKEREALRAAVHRYVDEAENEPLPAGRLVACIVPNGEYGLSGEVAGHLYKLIETGQYSRVILLTGSHFAKFRGCSIAAVQAYKTPLGEVPLDGPTIKKITYSSLISTRSLKYHNVVDDPNRAPVHEAEFGIEVELPFLQERLGLFWLVPIVVGELDAYNGGPDTNAYDSIVRTLRSAIDDQTLIVISSNFTHHGNAYSYRPFKDNVLEGVDKLDKLAFRYILDKDFDKFQAYLGETRNTIDGKVAIGLLLKLLPENAKGYLLAHETSSEKLDSLTNVVGYASIAFIDPTQPPAEAHPERALPPPVAAPPATESDAAPAQVAPPADEAKQDKTSAPKKNNKSKKGKAKKRDK